ncbi:hypothetical protein DFH09DRAFT_1113127 [Mycena vulgaris]|nr:hypothetical protein DFH09DRAFT_1113127 [Mycena vulgaris]
MVRLIQILGIETQITGMSASIPPQLFPVFCELTGTDSWDVIRMSSLRPKIRYGVILADSDKYIATAVKYVKDRIANDYEPNDKAMVFCRTRAIVDTVAELLGTTGYHSATPIATQDRVFRDWTTVKKPMIMCSSIGAPSTVHRVPSRAIACHRVPHAANAVRAFSSPSDVTRLRAGDGSRWLTMDRQRGADLYHISAKRKLRSFKVTIHFSIIGLVNTANISMFYIYTAKSLSWSTSAISVATMSRLVLNLHATAMQGTASTPDDAELELETFRFA